MSASNWNGQFHFQLYVILKCNVLLGKSMSSFLSNQNVSIKHTDFKSFL